MTISLSNLASVFEKKETYVFVIKSDRQKCLLLGRWLTPEPLAALDPAGTSWHWIPGMSVVGMRCSLLFPCGVHHLRNFLALDPAGSKLLRHLILVRFPHILQDHQQVYHFSSKDGLRQREPIFIVCTSYQNKGVLWKICFWAYPCYTFQDHYFQVLLVAVFWLLEFIFQGLVLQTFISIRICIPSR